MVPVELIYITTSNGNAILWYSKALIVFLFTAPSFFPFCYNIVKHILDEKTKKKVVVIGISSKFHSCVNWQ